MTREELANIAPILLFAILALIALGLLDSTVGSIADMLSRFALKL